MTSTVTGNELQPGRLLLLVYLDRTPVTPTTPTKPANPISLAYQFAGWVMGRDIMQRRRPSASLSHSRPSSLTNPNLAPTCRQRVVPQQRALAAAAGPHHQRVLRGPPRAVAGGVGVQCRPLLLKAGQRRQGAGGGGQRRGAAGAGWSGGVGALFQAALGPPAAG